MSFKLNVRNFFIFLIFAIYPIIPQYFGIAGISVFKMMCLGIVMLSCFFGGISKIYFGTYKNVVFAFIIWLLVMLLVCLLHGEMIEFAYELLCYYLVGLVAIKCLNSRDRFIWAIDLIIVVSTITALFGIVESFTDFNAFHLLNTMGVSISLQPLRFGFRRIIAFTYQTISYCSFCMFALALIFYRCTICNEKKAKIKYYIAYILVMMASILTLSRSLILCILLSQTLLLYACGYKEFVKRLFFVIIAIIVIGCIVSIIFPEVASLLQNLFYMLLALFDENYASLLGNVDGTGIGDRADLFEWVWFSVKDHMWLGMGESAGFAYAYQTSSGLYTYTRIKTSIENQYLNLLFHYGILGLVSMVWVYIQLFLQAVKKNMRRPAEWEGKISFPKMIAITFFAYFISFWGVHQIDEKRIFFCFIFLLLSYCMYEKYSNYER